MNFVQHRKLEGKRERLGDKYYYFFTGRDTYGPQKAHLPGFMSGAEGYAHPISDDRGQKYILKSFQNICSERIERMKWLSAHQLCKLDNLLAGAPYQFFDSPIDAQICPFVEGQTWAKWKSNPRLKLTPKQRIFLAHSLASTARLLEESIGLAHGDFSPGNIIIKGLDGNNFPELSLIDFDAYFHKDVSVLPKDKGRTQGTYGYQFSTLAKNAQEIVRSDRLALAVLIHEFLCFDIQDNPGTEEEHLLWTQDQITRGQALPDPNVAILWGDEINELIWKALKATKQEICPSPSDWCTAIGNVREKLTIGDPVLRLVIIRNGHIQKRLQISKGPKIFLKDELDDSLVDLVIEKQNNTFFVWNRIPKIPATLSDVLSKHITKIDGEKEKRRLHKGSILRVNNWEIHCVGSFEHLGVLP